VPSSWCPHFPEWALPAPDQVGRRADLIKQIRSDSPLAQVKLQSAGEFTAVRVFPATVELTWIKNSRFDQTKALEKTKQIKNRLFS
jgi:hypothetical protein